MSPNRKATAALISILVLANLLLVNDYATVLSGSESWMMEIAAGIRSPLSLTEWIARLIGVSPSFGSTFFMQRLAGTIVWAVGLFVFFSLAKQLFGELLSLIATLALAGSVVLTLVAKLAVSDAWITILLSINFLLFVSAIKKPDWKWISAYWASAILSLSVALLPTFLFCLTIGLFVYFLHPLGNRVRGMYFWIGWPALALLALMSDLPLYLPMGMWYSLNYMNAMQLTGLLMLGTLPWIGFLPAAFYDLYLRLRGKEEMAIILSCWLLASILSLSAAVFVPLIFMAARHSILSFKKAYPYDKINKATFILMEIALFLVVMMFILQSVQWFGPSGARSAMLICMILWGTVFAVIIGIFARRRFLAWGSLLIASPLCMLLFLTLYYPMIESARQAPKTIVQRIETQSALTDEIYAGDMPKSAIRPLRIYAKMLNKRLIEKNNTEEGTKPTPSVVMYQPVTNTDSVKADTLAWWWVDIPTDSVLLKLE